MLVREVPFNLPVFTLVACLVFMAALLVGYALSDDKKLGETINKVFMQFVAPAGLIVVAGAMVAHAVLSHQRLAAEGDYESVGSYAATVTHVYPHAVEVETEFGVSLPVTAAMMPEGASVVGATVTIDVSRLSSKPGLEVQRPSGDASSADSGERSFVERATPGFCQACITVQPAFTLRDVGTIRRSLLWGTPSVVLDFTTRACGMFRRAWLSALCYDRVRESWRRLSPQVITERF